LALCVGVGGCSHKVLFLKELGSEKIDIISWSDSLETMVKNALKPAEVRRVELVGDREARVWVDEDQRSLAIGKMGQNISLASRLLDMDIHLVQDSYGPNKNINQDDEPALSGDVFE